MTGWRGVALGLVVCVLATFASVAWADAEGDPGPQLMPPHPDVLARIAAEGYDSVTVLNLRHLAELKQAKGIDRPEPIQALVTGTRPALVLLVDYSDLTHNAASTPALYDDMLFSLGTYPAPGSMCDFYQEASYGLFDISPSLVDSAWRQVAHAHNYYADADGIPGTSDDYGFGSFPQNAQGLVVDAVTLADPYVDFSAYATGGQVQGIFIIHAGRGAETSSSHEDWIWSHKWGLYGNAVTVDGVTVNIYSMEPEYVWSAGDSTVGVFCHEYGHVLGLPDLYDTDYSCEGLGNWSLMAGGSWNGSSGSSPAQMDAYCKLQLGWITPTVLTDAILGASIPYAEDNPFAYQLWTEGVIGTEYFLLENRQLVGFDAALDGDGLLLYHVDEWASQNNDWHPKVMVEQADGWWDLQDNTNDGDAGDPYPGTSVNRTANASTTPATRSYGGADTHVSIGSISNSALTMTANLSVGTAQTWFEDDDPAIVYTGTWSELAHPAASAGHLKYSNETAATASIEFYGTGARWMLAVGPMAGKADVYLDGGYVATVDLYRSGLKLLTLEKTGLAPGAHTGRIEVSGTKNPSSSNYYVDIDAFEVVP